MKKSYIIGGASVLAIIGLIFYFKQKIEKKKLTQQIDNSASESTEEVQKQEEKTVKSTNAVPPTIDRAKILKLGTSSPEVKILQKSLHKLDEDGSFGNATKSRLFVVFRLDEISLNDYDKFFPKSAFVKTIHDRGKKIDVKKTYELNYDFLKNWSNAIANNKKTFNYLITTYDTSTGLKTTKMTSGF